VTQRPSHRWILGILILVLVGAILFAPSYGWKLRRFISPEQTYFGSQTATGDAADTSSFAAENAALKAQIATYQTVASQLPQNSAKYIRAMVYSRYPFNFKNELLVNAGAVEGVATGSAAVFQGVFIGHVTKVFSHESLIQTVFDSSFEMPVRVSTSSYDGLFHGGTYPNVGSLAKTANLQVGDVIYTAAPGLPYGLPVGEVSATSTSPDSLFTQATASFLYDINEIQTVLIAQGP
jgi:cell shape-determining protein MreC